MDVTHDLDVLMTAMTSADPTVRDGWAYEELGQGIADGRFADEQDEILTLTTSRLEDPSPWARSFAPLVMTWLADAGTFTRESFEAFAAWYPTERDTRGFDPEVGWIHAVAHGADYLGLLAERRLVPPAEVLALSAARMLGPGTAWTNQEDARITRAALSALTTCTSVADATDWLASITSRLDALEAEADADADADADSSLLAPQAWVHNTTMTCTKLHLALQLESNAEQILPVARDAVISRLRQIVLRVEPYIAL